MATTKTSKIGNVRYKFFGSLQGRDSTTTKDQRFVNMFPEQVEPDRFILVKRPGLDFYNSTINQVGRGIFRFNGSVWSVVGNAVYKNTTQVYTLATSTGQIGFTDCTEEGVGRLFFCDGTDAYVVDKSDVITKVNVTYSAWTGTTSYSAGAKVRPTVENTIYYEVLTGGTSSGTEPTWPITLGTTVTDGTVTWIAKGYYGGFPSPHTPTPVYIDGYVCLPHADSADIYNCDLENPYGWSASNFITSELFPDEVTALARQNNQVVAFGQSGTEFFFDNGVNQPTGTPLAKTSSAFLQMGTCAPYCIGQNERYCFFISQSYSGGRAVWKLDGFQPEKISDEAIGRILDYEGTAIGNATGYLIRLVGHFFFVICLSSRTIVYDIEEKLWHEWNSIQTVNITEDQINGAAIDATAINSTSDGSGTGTATSEWPWRYATDIGDGTVYLLHQESGVISKFNPRTYLDIDNFIQCEINTPVIDFGSYKRKFIHRMSLIGDLAPNSVFLKWSDNDYKDWSNTHQIDMENRPVLHRLGSTRRRAFNMYYSDNYPLRLEGLEFVVEEGET